jgi:pyroglutamyl-peptidase
VILVTGFAPYREAINASGALIASMRDDPPDYPGRLRHALAFEVIACDDTSCETEHRTLEDRLLRLLADCRPAFCLFTGQAPARNKVTFEKVAINTFMGERIDPARPVGYWADLPGLDRLPQALEAQDIPAALSFHGGQHLCNHILYSSLHFAADRGLPHRSGFMHIPVLPEQICRDHPDAPGMALEMTRRALSIVIGTLQEVCVDGRGG